ncbi:MAG: DUF2892 domain-containing protein [Gemmatimonadales bacterium]
MTPNMGAVDRVLRTLVAIVVAYLYFTGKIPGTLGIVLMVFAVIFVVTSFMSWCPIYAPFKFSTRGRSAGAS